MTYTSQASIREQFITALRDLADYLQDHPNTPVPIHGAAISLYAEPPESGGRGQVAHIAAQLGATVTDDTRNGGHLTATRMFGPISYTVVSIPATVMAAYQAFSSYSGCDTPDTP